MIKFAVVILVLAVFLVNQATLSSAMIRTGRYKDNVQETLSILNEEYIENWDELSEKTYLALSFSNLNDSKDYVVFLSIKGNCTKNLYQHSDNGSFTIGITITPDIDSISFCAYEYDISNVTLEVFSVTIYPLLWIMLYW